MKIWIAAALVSLSLVATARSDDVTTKDDWKWDAQKAWKPQVGSRRFEEKEITTKSVDKAALAGSEPYAEESCDTVSYRAVFEVVALADDGSISEEHVKFERWSLAPPGEDPDTTLQGRTLVLKGTGKARTSSFDDGFKPGPAARSWINAYFSQPESDALAEACLYPREPIAPGSSWTCDPTSVATALFPGVEIDPKKSSVKGKLGTVSVRNGVHFGHYDVKVSLSLKKSPDGVEWTNALQEISISADGSLEKDRSLAEDMKKEFRFSGKGAVKGKDAGELEEKAQTTIKSKAGVLAPKPDK